MVCPVSVTGQDRLRVHIGSPHGVAFSVTRPGEAARLWLGSDDDDPVASWWMPASKSLFQVLDAGGLRARDLVAWPTRYAAPSVKVFTRPGVYLFEVADVLDNDDPILDGWCKVTYRPRKGDQRGR